MKPYRFNPLLDTSRFLSGLLCAQKKDPYIQTSMSRISSRNHLFTFADINNDTAKCSYVNSGYQPYISPQPLLLEHLPEKYARHAYQHLLANKQARLQQITALLQSQQISVEPSPQSWMAIGDWIAEHIELNTASTIDPDKKVLAIAESDLKPIWHSLLIDLGLLLGEQMISLNKQWSWQFWADKPYEGAGRSPWILCEPLPSAKKWQHKPKIKLPLSAIKDNGINLLKDKLNNRLQAQTLDSGCAYLFVLMAEADTRPSSPPLESVEDERTLEFLSHYESYLDANPGVDRKHKPEFQEALDAWLQSYYKDFGHLPPKNDLAILEKLFGALPQWLKSKQ